MVQVFEGWPIVGSTAAPGHLESGMARDGHTSGQHPGIRALRVSLVGGTEPLD
jgi:hypothetical protein